MKTKTILLIAFIALTMTACVKETHQPTKDSANIESLTSRSGDIGPIIEIGELIDEATANSRIDSWNTNYPSYVVSGDLSLTNYYTLRDLDSGAGIGYAYQKDAGLLAFAVDSENKRILSTTYVLNSEGGTLITDHEADSLLSFFDAQETGIYGYMTMGFNLSDALKGQSGTSGLRIFNALDEDGTNIIARSYASNKFTFGNSGSGERLNCIYWVPGHPEIIHGSHVIWVPGHWADCGGIASGFSSGPY